MKLSVSAMDGLGVASLMESWENMLGLPKPGEESKPVVLGKALTLEYLSPLFPGLLEVVLGCS